MSSSTSLRAVRAYFGFSQPELAVWLGISRSLLALAETDRQQLPARARLGLIPWLAALAAAPAEEPAPSPAEAGLPPLPSAGPAPVLARLAECQYQAQRLGQQHAALLRRHRYAACRLAAGPLLLAALPPPHPDDQALTQRHRWLARLLEAAADALAPEAPTGPVAAVLLAARRQAYLHEATTLRAYLAD